MLLRLIYKFARLICKVMLAAFYPHTEVDGKAHLDFDSPAIIVSNHPNTLLDPLRSGISIRQHLFFLANAALFKSPFGNWFFSTFYCIKIERPKDIKGRKVNNKESLKAADEHLQKGGCLYIAPQGYSQNKRRIDEIKTGTARIALSAEESSGWDLGCKVVPFGLNYESPRFYRTKLLVRVGKPLYAKDYQAVFEVDNFKAACQMTNDLKTAMESLILDTNTDEEDAFVRQIEAVQQSEQPLNLVDGFHRSKKLVINLHEADETVYSQVKNAATSYRAALANSGIDDLSVKKAKTGWQLGTFLKNAIGFLFGLPIFLYGFFNNVFTLGIPAVLTKIIPADNGYDSNIKVLSSVIFWPIIYWWQTKLVFSLADNWWMAIAYALSIYPSLVFAWEFKAWVKRCWVNHRAVGVLKNNIEILNKRNAVLKAIRDV